MKSIKDIALALRDDATAVHLLYAFNSVGKTRLSVAYKNATKEEDGTHTAKTYSSGTTILRTTKPIYDLPFTIVVSAGFMPGLTKYTSARS